MEEKNCIFCKIISKEFSSYTLYEDEEIMAFFDINPANNYHTLVVPKKHYKDIFEIDDIILEKLIVVTKKICSKFKLHLDIENINILQSNGKYAGQEVFHYHIHIIPRFENDNIKINLNSKTKTKKEFELLLEKIKKEL